MSPSLSAPSIGLARGSSSPDAQPDHSETASGLPSSLGALLDEQVVRVGAAPGVTGGIARRSGTKWSWAVGCAGYTDPFNGDRVTTGTWFDLASLTKSVTALGVARAVERGLMAWGSRLADYLPFLDGTFGGDASLLSLLSHRAGFVAHTQLAGSSHAALRSLAEAKRDDVLSSPSMGQTLEPHAPLYSDVGYIFAGLALERCAGRDLDLQLQSELTTMADATSTWPTELASARHLTHWGVGVSQIAPTELVTTRGGLVRGQVHDDNAWTLSETSTSGHAGMFGTARGVLGLGTLLLDLVAGRSDALGPASVAALLAPRKDGSLRAGFDSKNLQSPSVAGRVLGSRTFGHLGFTGTSYWCDPDAETVVVLLTNRVCPSRNNLQLRAVRPTVHDALAHLALELPS